METERRKKFIVNMAYFAIILGISILLIRYALPALLPFAVAVLVSFILKPAVRWLNKKARITKSFAAVATVLVFYLIIGLALILVGVEAVNAVLSLIKQLPTFYKNVIEPALVLFAANIEESVAELDVELPFSVSGILEQVTGSLGSTVTNFSVKALTVAGEAAASVPKFLLNVIVSVISTIFLSMDWSAITKFIEGQLSEKSVTLLHNIFSHLGQVIKKYILSYALIMLITFVELLIGLGIVGIKNPMLIALLIAIFDLLPIVGSGTILFPWAVITLVTGSTGRGIGLLIVWAVVIIMRYIIEPKIVGNHVGLHPLLTLFAMIAGVFLYGGIGILILPVTLALCQSLNESGAVHIYNSVPRTEEKEEGIISKFLSRAIDYVADKLKILASKLWELIKKLCSAVCTWTKNTFDSVKAKIRPNKKK